MGVFTSWMGTPEVELYEVAKLVTNGHTDAGRALFHLRDGLNGTIICVLLYETW